MSLINISNSAVLTEDGNVIVVYDGARGPRGTAGATGDTGPAGTSLNIRGPWVSGATYAPNDAVTSRSSADTGIQSLWVQRSDAAEAVSTTAPHLDTARWEEVGATDLSNLTGAFWQIYQIAHGFTQVGTPVAFSSASELWQKADNTTDGVLALGVVREVINADNAVIQTTGEVPDIDPSVIYPDGSSWQHGRAYYVSGFAGRLELSPASFPSGTVTQPILIPTRNHAAVDDMTRSVGVVVPWAPVTNNPDFVVTGMLKFYYTATGGQTVFSGLDDQGNTLAYQVGANTDVFLEGLNLSELTDYTAADGTSITLTTPAQAGDIIEIWTPDRDISTVVPSTAVKVDNIENQFNGVLTDFALTINGGTPVTLQSAPNVLVFLDGNVQEPDTDYSIVDSGGNSVLSFTEPPLSGERFWAIIFVPTGT